MRQEGTEATVVAVMVVVNDKSYIILLDELSDFEMQCIFTSSLTI